MSNFIIEFFKKRNTYIPIEKRNKKLVFLIVLCALTLDNLNVNAALVSTNDIEEKFNSTPSVVAWVVASYALTLGAFIVIFGKIADIIGAHLVFLIGLCFMSLFSLIVAVIDHSIIALIIFRAFQGMAGAALIPSAFALAANYFQGPHLSAAIRVLIIALTASMGLGVVLGGAFQETSIGYKGFYYFCFAYSAVCAILLFFIIIPTEQNEQHKKMKFKNLDFIATFGLVVGTLLMILGFTEGGNSWRSPKAYVPLPVGFVVLATTYVFEVFYLSRYQEKFKNSTSEKNWRSEMLLIFPSEMFKIPNFWVFLIVTFSLYIVYVITTLVIVDFHLYVAKDSAIVAAVKILPVSVGVVITSIVFRIEYAAKIGYKACLIFSIWVTGGMIIWNSRLNYTHAHNYWVYEFVPLSIFGMAMNVYFQVYLNVVMFNTPLHLQANVSGVFQTISQLGVSLGSAIVSTVLGSFDFNTSADKMQTKITNSLYVNVAFASLSCILILFAKSGNHSGDTSEVENAENADKEKLVDDNGDPLKSEGEDIAITSNSDLQGSLSSVSQDSSMAKTKPLETTA